jgi:flagellar basal body P-ring formation protein FlgA
MKAALLITVLLSGLGLSCATWAAPASAEQAPAAPDLGTPAVTPLTRDELLASLTRDIAAHFNLEGDLAIELIRTWTPPARVASRWNVEILDYPNVPSSAMMLRCRVSADADVVADTTLMVRATLWRDAWTTRFPLTSGASFDATLLDVRRVDMLRDRDAVPAAVGDHGYMFVCAVPAGRLLTWRDIARKPLVKKGEMVDVSATDGGLMVTMKGLAMENGGRGDTVTIRNPDSRKDFAARVIDENRVQVRF